MGGDRAPPLTAVPTACPGKWPGQGHVFLLFLLFATDTSASVSGEWWQQGSSGEEALTCLLGPTLPWLTERSLSSNFSTLRSPTQKAAPLAASWNHQRREPGHWQLLTSPSWEDPWSSQMNPNMSADAQKSPSSLPLGLGSADASSHWIAGSSVQRGLWGVQPLHVVHLHNSGSNLASRFLGLHYPKHCLKPIFQLISETRGSPSSCFTERITMIQLIYPVRAATLDHTNQSQQ